MTESHLPTKTYPVRKIRAYHQVIKVRIIKIFNRVLSVDDSRVYKSVKRSCQCQFVPFLSFSCTYVDFGIEFEPTEMGGENVHGHPLDPSLLI
jgi:hypothetical protein